MTNRYTKRISENIPLFLGGIFMVYLAVLDETLFNFILDNMTRDQLTIALATTVASALPMFFAVGFIKQSFLYRWQTIYHYEKLLLGNIFWILTVFLLISILIIKIIEESMHQFNAPILIGCMLFSIYLVIRWSNKRQKYSP
jgi:hypothetical protein